MGTPVLLLLDEFSGHWRYPVLACARELNVELMPVPAGCTSVFQRADVAWNRPIKTRLRTRWIEYLERQMADHEASIVDGKTFKMIAPSRDDVVEWVASAWSDLTADTIANGFKGVLKESSEKDDEVALLQINHVVERLDNLGLLDNEVGEVAEDQDYVDRVVNSIEYADV
uniref:DDE-1 domain-containing protein n=1 Tax=Phytophthora ramorum TaxID=164328 RepID=H3H6B4_PHYRM